MAIDPMRVQVLVDAELPGYGEDLRLLLGPSAVLLNSEAATQVRDLFMSVNIVHVCVGSELWKVLQSGALTSVKTPAPRQRLPAVVVHHPEAHEEDDTHGGVAGLRLAGVNVLEVAGPQWRTADADVGFDSAVDPAVDPWERAAALGSLYLAIIDEPGLRREIALSLAAMKAGAAAARTSLRARPFSAPSDRNTRSRIDSNILGVPAITVAPNSAYSRAYLADRAGLRVMVRGGNYCPEQPVSFWSPTGGAGDERVLLPPQQPLEVGEWLTVLDDRIFDLALATPMILIRRELTGAEGYVTLDALVTKMEGEECEVWAAEQPYLLRPLVEFRCSAGTLYSTNRVGPNEVRDSIAFLARFADPNDDLAADPPHPLQVGAHAHRLGVWALDEGRNSAVRGEVTRLFVAMLERYAGPVAHEITPDAVAWPYSFDFRMPWATELKAPWYSGYANAAMAGAMAVGGVLTGDEKWSSLSRRAVNYLRLPMAQGGALYHVDGYEFIAEYCYRSPPIPNYRVLDGEICSPQYLHNAALLLNDTSIMSFAVRLMCGLTTSLRLLRRPDHAPLFGMDGQAMNPNYMWQLWMCLQLLAAISKDRTFTRVSREWKPFIPGKFWDEGHPY